MLRNRADGSLKFIAEWLPFYLPLRYPILYPRGEHGWHQHIPRRSQRATAGATLNAAPQYNQDREQEEELDEQARVQPRRGPGRHGSRRVSQKQWFSYYMQVRPTVPPVLLAGRLLHEWMVDAFAAMESNRLQFFRKNQSQLRVAAYKGLIDAISLNDGVFASDLGLPIILPATHIGSPRHMRNSYLDAMAIVRHFGAPDLFITMTCNPRWLEVTRELLFGQDPVDRPDLLNRVFMLKLDALLYDLTKRHVLGEAVAWCASRISMLRCAQISPTSKLNRSSTTSGLGSCCTALAVPRIPTLLACVRKSVDSASLMTSKRRPPSEIRPTRATVGRTTRHLQ